MTTKESDYTTYVKAFKRLFEAYDAAEPYLDLGEDFKYFVSRKRHWLERLASPEFPVAFLGAFSAGKSTIINAVLGDDILPQATKSFTAIPTLIRKGAGNRAVIHYLGEREREELKGLYVEELSKELRKPAETYLKLGKGELLGKLAKDIEQHRGQFGSFNKQKFYDELKVLIDGWNKLSGAVKEIALAELPAYVTEDYEDVLFVDKAEIYLANVSIPENVVLVDLPGLGVVNPRHRKVTKSYVENDAKAFVIAMKVFHLLEGEEIELLAEIHSQRKRVLQRAFWVINQWDVLSTQHKREELANFEEKIAHYGFQISKDRVFRVSALNYLLLKLIRDNKLEGAGKIREHVDALKKAVGKIPNRQEAENYLKALEEAKNFVQFRAGLFDYLAGTAKAEFLDEARGEYLDLAARLKEKLDPLFQSYKHSNDDGMKNAFIAGELSRRQDETIRQLRDTVEEHIKQLRTEILPDFEFWRDQDQEQLAEQIRAAIDGLDRKSLKNELLKGLDLHSVVSRLPHKIEENLRIQNTFRIQLQELLEEHIVNQYLRQLLDAIVQVDALPEEVVSSLRDRLNGRDILHRLKGMCDVFLFDYGNIIDDLGRTIMTSLAGGQTEEEVVDLVQKNADAALEVAKSLKLIGPNDSVKQVLSLGLDKLLKVYGAIANVKQTVAEAGKSNDIDYALDYYKSGLMDYTRKQQQQINKYARRGIKNYFEELEEELLAYFEVKKSDIARVIMEQLTADIDSELGAELQKQKIIKDAYQVATERLA
ncbi:dynamin family protein [Methylococcus sp. EFPC2]|uniref:dynamin family protein n=1 Tax=Methylococcus sp. EFPC2 TaxID=2812648 RepID=UPI0019685B0A|nr:dynamin family protein [Methylococcus sp. EFPC2]QSA96032.1 dynamin family protein [Methylococcus sp. EFPC2]